MKDRNEIKYGAIISYLLIILNAIYGLVTVPFILGYIGDSTYGVYKTVASLSASLSVVDLGLGATITRYIAHFKAKKDEESANNFIGMCFIELAIIVFVLLAVSLAFFLNINNIYSETFADNELTLAKKLFLFLVANIGLTMIENMLFGIINGNGKFAFSNSVKVASILLKSLLLFVFLPVTKNVFILAISQSVVIVLAIIVFIVYAKKKLHVRPKITNFDSAVFKESFKYTLYMFIQNIVIQFNGNVDNILIGAKIGTTAVTVYSMSLTIYMMYEHIATSISNLMLPRMTEKVTSGASSEELQTDVERVGRFQYFLLGGAVGGFIILGKDFYLLWLGNGYEDCYPITLLLMVAVTFPVVQNTSLSILRAQNRMLYRTVTLIVSCLFNIAFTIFGIIKFGYFGAAVATAIAKILNCILMNIYYKRVLGFRILKMFSNIMLKTTICLLVPVGITFLLHRVYNSTWLSFILSACVFIATYMFMLMIFGFRKDEKNIIFEKVLKRKRCK